MSQSVVIGLKIAFVDFEDVFLEALIACRYIFCGFIVILAFFFLFGHFSYSSAFIE